MASEYHVSTCHLCCATLGGPPPSDGTDVARGHAGSEDYNTFDDIPQAYGVLTEIESLSEEEERAEYGADWAAGACEGAPSATIRVKFSLSLAAAVLGAASAGVGGPAGALTGALEGAGNSALGAIAGAVTGAIW